MTDEINDEGKEVEWPIDGVLDLHLFRPGEVSNLVPDYLDECRRRGILSVRIIHGKGTGQLREKVHSILRKTPGIIRYNLAPSPVGGWGATLVEISPETDSSMDDFRNPITPQKR